METARLVDHQIRVEVSNREGVITLTFSDGQTIRWPVSDPTIIPGSMYLTLSPRPELPDKAALARQILKEILQGGQ